MVEGERECCVSAAGGLDWIGWGWGWGMPKQGESSVHTLSYHDCIYVGDKSVLLHHLKAIKMNRLLSTKNYSSYNNLSLHWSHDMEMRIKYYECKRCTS